MHNHGNISRVALPLSSPNNKGSKMEDNKEKLTTEEVQLTQEEVQEKIDELKKDILDKKIDTVKLVNSMNTTLAKLEEYKAKKTKARKRNKIQKESRKKNR